MDPPPPSNDDKCNSKPGHTSPGKKPGSGSARRLFSTAASSFPSPSPSLSTTPTSSPSSASKRSFELVFAFHQGEEDGEGPGIFASGALDRRHMHLLENVSKDKSNDTIDKLVRVARLLF